MLAERYFPDDPNTSLLKLRQLAELLAQLVAANVGLTLPRGDRSTTSYAGLQDQGLSPREVAQLFGRFGGPVTPRATPRGRSPRRARGS